MNVASQDSNSAISNAIKELAHHDAANRALARRLLIAGGETARIAVCQTISNLKDPESLYYDELVRVRDWLTYGVDPRKLARWLIDLDLMNVWHPNGVGGAIPILIRQPGFKALFARRRRLGAWIEHILLDERQSYTRRAGMALLLHRFAQTRTVEQLILALEHDIRPLIATGRTLVELTPAYRDAFILSLAHVVGALTREHYPIGISLSGNGLWKTGTPNYFLNVEVAKWLWTVGGLGWKR
jgi:hypothetical protein